MFRLWATLTKDKSASTFIRLAKSQHVADLRLIFWSSCVLMFLGSVFIAVSHHWIDSNGIIGPSALISVIVGTGCGVLVWTYQTGSARLGTVDLFACEITTICRVIAIAETAPRYIQMARKPPLSAVNFNSQEQYTPVFDQNAKDLETLEARVVERVTEFYTYLKAMRDYLRVLNTIHRPFDDAEQWRMGVRNIIYMLFLMLESARRSVERLIEYEPEQVQNTITILLSELAAYGFLVETFEDEARERPGYNARRERLRLRRDGYLKLVPEIYWKAHGLGADKEWEPAAALLEELKQHYHDAFDEWITPNEAEAAQ